MRTTQALLFTLLATAATALPVIKPKCENPAPYTPAPFTPGQTCPAPGHIVVLRDEADPIAATRQIEQRCGFSGSEVSVPLGAFFNIVTPAQIACIRCDSQVRRVEENFSIALPGLPLECATPPDIPALSDWTSIILAALLGSAGVMTMRR